MVEVAHALVAWAGFDRIVRCWFEELVSLGERVVFVLLMQCKAREVMCNQIQGIATVERSVGARMTAHGALASFLSTSDTLGSGLEGLVLLTSASGY